MNSRQKEVQQQFLDNEKEVLKKLKRNYQDALDEINSKIEILLARQDADMQHVIYQVEYQRALKKQVQSILEQLQNNEFDTLSEFLSGAYEDAFVGTLYDLQGQGVPFLFPIDQEQVIAAIKHETKLTSSLYTELGHDIQDLQKKIAGEISRGIATGAMYSEISRNIASYARIPRNRAMSIARTEAHRIQCAATMDVQYKAKEKGADIVKQWDSTLDGATRPTHRELDGQVRELDEPFKVAGKSAMYPGAFGDPAEDCNCRCALLQRARWALGDKFTKWDKEQGIVEIDAESLQDFHDKYRKHTQSVRSNVQKINEPDNSVFGKNVRLKTGNMSSEEYAESKRPLANFKALQESKVVDTLRKDSRKWIQSLTVEERKAIEKYTLNSGDSKPNRLFERINEMLRGARGHDDKLQRYADTISTALGKNRLQHDVICYRRVSVNVYGNYEAGEIFKEPQFISTSVVRSKALKGDYEVVIYAKKGSRCGYIEEISKKPSQRELLIDKNTIFRVLSNKENVIELEVI